MIIYSNPYGWLDKGENFVVQNFFFEKPLKLDKSLKCMEMNITLLDSIKQVFLSLPFLLRSLSFSHSIRNCARA